MISINSIQKLLSYIWDVQIDYRYSEVNGDLIVYLVKGKYQLCTSNAIYSYEDRYDNFGNIFRNHIDLSRLPGNRVLVLGLGMGSVPIILDRLSKGNWDFTAVEIDPVICELAALYGCPNIQSPIQTIVADASDYIVNCTQQFDLICLDIFLDDLIPEKCSSVQFLDQVKKCVASGGLVVANTLAFNETQKVKSMKFYKEVFSATFESCTLIRTHKNYMLLSQTELLTQK